MKRMIRIVLVALAVAALALPMAAQQADNQSASNPLVQLLQSKGILSQDEAASVSSASTTAQANERLARLLWSKGLISQEEYNSTVAAAAASLANTSTSGARMVNTSSATGPAAGTSSTAASADPMPAPKSAVWPISDMMSGYDPSDGATADAGTLPAIAPVRVLPITLPKNPSGIIPDIKLGSGAMINLYGFFKATAVSDTTNSGGTTFENNDFPLPLLLGDTGPNAGSQFHVKARESRFGANFTWPISGPDITLTGRIEFDWAGDYTSVNNTNISSLRTSQAALRLAYMRMDAKIGDVPWFAEFGQDWTILASSTQYDVINQLAGVAFGNPYERVEQFKTGLQFTAGKLKFEPEVAMTLAGFGDNNLNNAVNASLLGASGVLIEGFQDQNRFGATLGSSSGEPGVQGRIVFDFPLDSNWKGVPNAELIASGGHAEAEYIVLGSAIPESTLLLPTGVTSFECANGTTTTNLHACYPTGLTMNVPQNMFTVEAQLPTPWFTLVTKAYKGDDMRFMFAGQLNSAFADETFGPAIAAPPAALICVPGSPGCTTTVSSTCPAAVVALGAGCNTLGQSVYDIAGDPITFVRSAPVGGVSTIQVAPYRPIRGYGGMAQLGFPLSRIFHANPDGRNAGWRFFTTYGVDGAYARDVIRSGGNHLARSDFVAGSLRYKINRWAELVQETTWYDTRTADDETVDFRGIPAHVNHDWRNEFGTIFTF